MKKLLLTAVFALLGLSSVCAQSEGKVRYVIGESLQSADQLESGLYFIRAHASESNGDMAYGEGIVRGTAASAKNAASVVTDAYDFPDGSTVNLAYLWEIEVIKDGDGERPDGASYNSWFRIKNFNTNKYLSLEGRSPEGEYLAVGNIKWCVEGSVDDAALFQMEDFSMPDSHPDYYGQYIDCHRFFIQLTNARGNGGTYPYIHTQGSSTLTYDDGCTIDGTAVQFDFAKAELVHEVNITVYLPSYNGQDLGSQTIAALLDKDPSKQISYFANQMGKGGFTITGLYADPEYTVPVEKVTEAGQVIYAKGDWERELKTDIVYRIRFNPLNKTYAALRYMLSTGKIETLRGNSETISRIVPERLWYFTKTDGGYLLHTLYDTSKSVKFTPNGDDWDSAAAGLDDEGTPLEFHPNDEGDFFLKIAGTESAWVSDYDFSRYMTVWDDAEALTDGSSKIRLYPLTDNDFAELALFATDEQIALAKANPTVDNIKPLVEAYNSNNIEAALKRIEYFVGNHTLGHNPGEYSDPSGKFIEAVENLKKVVESGNATDEEKQAAIDAVNGLIDDMSPNQLTRNPVVGGKFYRIRTKLNDRKFISALYGGVSNGKDVMAIAKDGGRSNTVFYVQPNDDGKFTVICFENGLVLPNLKGSSWMPVLHGSSDASTGVIFEDTGDGCFAIKVDDISNCYLYSGDGNSDIVTATNNYRDGNARWYIEPVTELPLTFYNVMGVDDYDDGWASVYSPIALEIPANYERTQVFTGILDLKDYHNTTDINHVLATPAKRTESGTVIIPANQPTLLYYDGKQTGADNPNVNESLIDGRKHISYINVPILYGDQTPVSSNASTQDPEMLPLYGSYFAVPKQEGLDYYTLHASHANNFREYSEYDTDYSYIPGFKAYIEKQPDEIDRYPICQINPNTMAPADGEKLEDKNYQVSETSSDSGERSITIILDAILTTADVDVTNECVLYYKLTPEAGTKHRLVSHDGYETATRDGNEHTFTAAPGRIDYYVYHPATDTKSADRTFTLNSDGTTTEIKEVSADGYADKAAEYYDLQGRRLNVPAKGIIIVNGKKILVK